MEVIQSINNEKVKSVRQLQSKKGRRKQQAYLVEGPKLLAEAIQSKYEPLLIFIQEDAVDLQNQYEDFLSVYLVSHAVMKSLCEVDTPQKIVATVAMKQATPLHYEEGLYLAIDGIQDPGNMGTILRNADAFGVKGVLIGEGSADIFSPKCLRSAMGSTFHIPIFITENLQEELKRAKEANVFCLATVLDGKEEKPQPMPAKTMLLIGNEGNGIRDEIVQEADYGFRLAMRGQAESLNAGVFTGILLYDLTKDW